MINCYQCGREHNAPQCPWCANDRVQRQMLELQRAQMNPQYHQQTSRGPNDLAAATFALLLVAGAVAWMLASLTAFGWMAAIILLNFLVS